MRRAFTMLELLIVLIVIGLLVAIAAPRFSRARESSRMAATISTYNAIARAAEFYLADNNAYPPDYVQKSSHALFKPYINTSIFQSATPWAATGTGTTAPTSRATSSDTGPS